MKTLIEMLESSQEFYHFILFQGRFGGAYGLVVPHVYAERIRKALDEASDGYSDHYEIVVKMEELLLETPNYPGAKGNDINTIIETVTEKLNNIDSSTIFTYLEENVIHLLGEE